MRISFAKEITKFHYNGLKGPFGVLFSAIVFLPLLSASVFYYAVISAKNFLYKIGFLKETSVGAKVICIGNLTTGGVGKTPVTIEFCKFLSKKYKVSSLSRGYGGKLKGANIVRDFEKILITDPKLTGDEVNLIAKESTGFAVVQSADRVAGAKKAIEELGAEIIVMDDGFSNRKIVKNLSLLLFDVNKLAGNGGVLPFGPLREPVSEINRAEGLILIDKENSPEEKFAAAQELIRKKYKFKGKIFKAHVKPDYFYNIKTDEIFDIRGGAEISHCFAFSGIGQPDLFYQYLKNCLRNSPEERKGQRGFNPSCTLSFEDHHEYTKEDIKAIENLAKKRAAKFLVTTEKDAVKLGELILGVELPVLALKLKTEIDVQNILSELGFKGSSTEHYENCGKEA